MPRVSEYYSLGVSQPSLEFLDVDVVDDVRVFVDPSTFRYMENAWAKECVSLLEDYYDELLMAIREKDAARVKYLLGQLHEPNETHLGLSQAVSQGSGVGGHLADLIAAALGSSEAITTGIVTNIEDTLLFVEGIDHDRVSDMTINIVRRQLIAFTQGMCKKYGIPTVEGLASGPFWNRNTHAWEQGFVSLPMPTDAGKLILVPRAIVRTRGVFDAGDYLTHFVLPYLQHHELESIGSLIIKHRKDGTPYVTKKSLRQRRNGPTKPWNTEVTTEAPELLESYRDAKAAEHEPPDHPELAEVTGSEEPDWDALLNAVLEIEPGASGADRYHRRVQDLLTALFYPALDFPRREFKLHEGRKRIDITFENLAEDGFFRWLETSQRVPSSLVVVECKNYTGQLDNPEFDQLTGRFATTRGQFGLLLYRGFGDDKARVIRHCKDAAADGRGYVIALDDEDLQKLVESRKGGQRALFQYLIERFRDLT